MSSSHPSLGKYQVVEEIGRGGMGAVYKGHDPLLDRAVAIKLLAPHLVWEKDFVERFLREARGAARLRHPNIIEIHDVGQDGSNYFFVMTYLPGPSLKDLILQKKRLTPAEALPILHQLADALDYAHSKGLVHRDVKPANVMFDERGQAVLMDFGIVKAAQESKLTATGASIGTPHYMAPEQVQGTGVDARTDEYALGIIAFEMLTGRVPFDGDTTTAILFKQVHEPPPSVTACCPDLPPAIEAVLNRVMIKSPAERYASCREFVGALEQALGQPATQPVTVPQPVPPPIAVTQPFKTPTEPKPKPQPAPRPVVPPLLLAGVGIVALVLVALIVVAVSRGGGSAQVTTPTAIAAIQPTSAPANTVIPAATQTPAPTNTLVPSATPTRQPTETPSPTNTPLPGIVVVPIEKMARSIPWLSLDKGALPCTFYYGFNINKRPFDNRLVRQAFAAAIDRRTIADLANKYGVRNARPATTFTPPEILGRNLYGQVGIPLNPAKAQALLAEAGYPNGQGFPTITVVTNRRKDDGDGNVRITNAIIAMWQENLKVNVKIEVFDDFKTYGDLLKRDAPAIYRLTWVSDSNDPDSFLKGVFHSQAEYNFGHLSNAEFDRLLEQAATLSDPATRQALYIQAERILCQDQTAVIPLYHYTTQGQ